MGARKRVDYDRIEAGWRAGLLSPRQLAAAYTEETGEKVSHAAIIKHFTERGIPRDLSAKIHAKADAMVTAAMVTGKVTPDTKIPEKRIVDEGATMVTEVRLGQRRDIKRSRDLVMQLLAELELQTTRPELFEEIEQLLLARQDGEELSSAARTKLQDGLNKALSLSSRSSTMRSLAESLRILITLEREAWGLKGDNDGEGGPQGSGSRELTDAERAVRLSRLLASNPGALAAILGSGTT